MIAFIWIVIVGALVAIIVSLRAAARAPRPPEDPTSYGLDPAWAMAAYKILERDQKPHLW